MSKPTINPLKLKHHPLCTLFPQMGDDAYKALVKSIKENGYDQSEPLITLDGLLLDGAHRQTACQKLKIVPPTKEYKGDDPFGFVVGKNLARRHLDPSQSAAIGAEIVELMKQQEKAEKEAAKAEEKAAKEKAKKTGKPAPKAKPAKKTRGSKAAKAAAALNVSERSVAAAEALKKDDPAAFEEVKAGKKTLNAATTAAAVKKSTKDRESEAFATACQIIDRVIESGFSEKIKNKISSKDLVKFSGLDEAEMIRVAPYLDSGWKLAAAMGFKAVSLSAGHTIRQLIDRSIAQGGKYTLSPIELYGDEWTIDVSKREGAAS